MSSLGTFLEANIDLNSRIEGFEGFVIQSREDFESTNKSLLTVLYQREIKKTQTLLELLHEKKA